MTEREYIENFIKDVFGIADEDFIKKLCAPAVLVSLRKGEVFLSDGEPQSNLALLAEGGVRTYSRSENNKEVTESFLFNPGDPVMCVEMAKPSCATFVAYKRTKIITIPFGYAMTAIFSNEQARAKFEEIAARWMAYHAEVKQHLHNPASERWLWFVKTYPGLVDDVSDRDIANFLGMTPVTLSRLRHTPEIQDVEAAALAEYHRQQALAAEKDSSLKGKD